MKHRPDKETTPVPPEDGPHLPEHIQEQTRRWIEDEARRWAGRVEVVVLT